MALDFLLNNSEFLFRGLSSGAGVASGLFSAGNDVANAQNRAQSNEFDALVSEIQARDAIELGRVKASDFKTANSARLATHRAKEGGSGFTAKGSPMLIDDIALAKIEEGVGRILHDAEVNKSRFLDRATQQKFAAKAEKSNAKRARISGIIGAVGGVASSFGEAFSLRSSRTSLSTPRTIAHNAWGL